MISVVIPVFNEQENLPILHDRLSALARKMSLDLFEFIFVDDASSDHTPDVLKTLFNKDARVKIVRFAANAGSHAAVSAGLRTCKGDCVIVMAADLQDPPELIEPLVARWKNQGKLIWGVRSQRLGESILTKFCSRMYYFLMNRLTSIKMPPSGADVFCADRVVIDAFNNIKEKHTSVLMTLAWLGFKQESIEYVKEERLSGTSKWTLAKKIKLTLDSILSFSDIPIRYMSVLGFSCSFLGFAYAVNIFWHYFHGEPITGWSSLMVAILVIGGVQMMMLGLLGEYLWRTYDEVRQRPKYIIDYVMG